MRKESLKKDGTGNKNGTSTATTDADADFDALFKPTKSTSSSPGPQPAANTNTNTSSSSSSIRNLNAFSLDSTEPVAMSSSKSVAEATTTATNGLSSSSAGGGGGGGDSATAPQLNSSLAASAAAGGNGGGGQGGPGKTKAARKATHISYADDCKSADFTSDEDDDEDASAAGERNRSTAATAASTATAAAAAALDDDDDTTGDSRPAPSGNGDSNSGDAVAEDDADDDEAAADADHPEAGAGAATAAAEATGDYEVEDIVAHKLQRKRLLFQVRWKGYSPADDTWEPETLLDCPQIIERYRAAHPDAVAPPAKQRKSGEAKLAKKAAKKVAAAAKVPRKNAAGEIYEVEQIVGHRIERKRNVFLIRWKGYDASGDTWEQEATLSCPELLAAYREAHGTELLAAKVPKKRHSSGGGGSAAAAAGSPQKKRAKGEKRGRKPKEPVDEERDYEVAAIVAEDTHRGQTQFLVRWKGYTAAANTWEKESNLNCPELIAKYRAKDAAKRPSVKRGAKDRAQMAAAYGEDEDSDAEVMPAKKKRGSGQKEAAAAAEAQDYEVERIEEVKTEKGRKFYLVKWKGWPKSSNTWEPLASLSCADLLRKFEEARKPAAAASPKKAAKASPAAAKTPLTKGARKSSLPPATPGSAKGRGRPAKAAAAATTASSKKTTPAKAAKAAVAASALKSGSSPRGRGRPSLAASASSSASKKVAKAAAKSPPVTAGRGRKARSTVAAAPINYVEVDMDPLADDEPKWEVQKIVDVRTDRDGSTHFLIRWKGCKAADDTWEPEENVDSPKLVRDFWATQATAVDAGDDDEEEEQDRPHKKKSKKTKG